MKVFNSLDEINNVEPTVTALGNFDGIHKGHRELISLAVAEARKAGLMSAVFTFSTHPRNAFGRNAVKNIISAEEKAQIIADLGVDYLFNLPFADEIRTLSPSEFIDRLLIEKFNMKEGFCGFNYTFGYKAEGTPEMLKAEGAEKGFKIHVLEPYTVDGEVVSSTLIRKIIEKGEVELCRKYMDRNFAAGGVVIEGNRLGGTTLGFPTANINIDESMILPPNGVYITKTLWRGAWYPSITNVGNKPTIGEYAKNMETHILDTEFNRDLYGEILRVEFLKKLRDEKKFDSLDALRDEIARNCDVARAYHLQTK